MPYRERINLTAILSLAGSGVGFITVVVVFAFMNFETKTSAIDKIQPLKEKDREIEANITEIRQDVKEMRRELSDKLDRVLMRITK